MSDLLDRVVIPLASEDDARATARALNGHEFGAVLAVHVIEKAGGAPDKAGVEQREQVAEAAFEAFEASLDDSVDLETRLRYGTDVADAIFEAAEDYSATAIVVTPRGGSRWIQLLTGDVALSLVTETDRPVIVFPDVDHHDGDDGGDDQSSNDETVDGGSEGE